MALRYLSAISALIYGLLMGYLVVAQGLHYGIQWSSYWRVILALTAFLGAGMVLSGRSALWVLVTMVFTLLSELRSLAFILPGVMAGTWTYSEVDFFEFPLLSLPVLAVLFSLIAIAATEKIKNRA